MTTEPVPSGDFETFLVVECPGCAKAVEVPAELQRDDDGKLVVGVVGLGLAEHACGYKRGES